jgi:hypothetical protein
MSAAEAIEEIRAGGFAGNAEIGREFGLYALAWYGILLHSSCNFRPTANNDLQSGKTSVVWRKS